MPVSIEPNTRAVLLAEKALGMKVNVQAVLDHIEEEKRKYRERMGYVLEGAEETMLQYSLSDDVTDDALNIARRNREMIGDPEETLATIYGSIEDGIASMHEMIDGRILSTLPIPMLLANQKTREERQSAIAKMIDVALWQAMALLEFDEYTDAHLVAEANNIVSGRLHMEIN